MTRLSSDAELNTGAGSLSRRGLITDHLFLIAHRVRNAPAFDIATQMPCAVCEGSLTKTIGLETGEPCDCENGFWWIIPTSGHGAYPYWWVELEALLHDDDYGFSFDIPPMPPNLPDHYACNDRPLGQDPAARIDLQALGLVKPRPAIDRRI